MSSQWNTAPGGRPAQKWPWAPWLTLGGSALSLLMMLVPWVTIDGEDDKSLHFNKLGGVGWLKMSMSSLGSDKKISDGGWSAHAWLTVLVLVALIVVATMLLSHIGHKMLSYVLLGLGALLLIMAIWGIVAASTLSGSINDLGSNDKDPASMAAGVWLFLLTALVALAGVVLSVLPLFVKPKAAPQMAYGQPGGWGQQPQGGYPQAPEQAQWGQPQPQQGGYPQAPQQGGYPQQSQQGGWGQAPQQPQEGGQWGQQPGGGQQQGW